MKDENKKELRQIAFNHLSDIEFQDFINLYKRYNSNPYSFLVIDTTLASGNQFQKESFRNNARPNNDNWW